MERKHTRAISVKGKLISALCMLLVAVIMVVSSTYAWFTLSTAPEVTGISTAIGANGALEMRLNRVGYDPLTGEKKENGAVVDTDRYTTWGNLVDLSGEGYGLNMITLLPSTMKAEGGKYLNLQVPTYESDGRPSSTLINTVFGDYNGNAFVDNTDATGVRAVGVASGLSARQMAYRNAKQVAKNAMDQAKNGAQKALTTNGSTLANVVVKKATFVASTEVPELTFSATEVAAFRGIVDAFKDDDSDKDILDYIENAYVAQFLGIISSASAEEAIGGAEKADILSEYFETNVKTLADLVTKPEGENAYVFRSFTLADSTTFDVPSNAMTTALLSGINKYYEIKADVDGADAALKTLETRANTTTYTWDDLNTVIPFLVDSNNMLINGYTTAAIIQDQQPLVNDVLAGKGITVSMANGSGIFTDVAEQCGDYTASIKLTVQYGSLTITDAPASMATATIENKSGQIAQPYIGAVLTLVEAAGEPSKSGAAEAKIVDYYGYIIDLSFRTNAAESNLLLQVEGKDRIYAGNQNPQTQGAGSHMVFTSTTPGFTDEQISGLMSAIRIVFFNTEDNAILAYARLDTENATTDANGTKANLFICSESGDELPENDANKIVALNQNAEHKISVLVYLEGDTTNNKGGVDNGDVAATAQSARSLVGNLNLQFASSATLVPMEYGDLHIQGSESASASTPASDAP